MKTTQAYTHACFAVGDFSFFDARADLQQRMPQLYTSQFHKLVAEGPQVMSQGALIQSKLASDDSKGLAEEATSTTDKLQGQVTNFSREIANEASNKPTDPSQLPDWKKKLMDKNEENRKALAKMCDESMNNAFVKIRELPEEKRDEAADKWTSAWDFIMNAVKKVIEFLDKAWHTIMNLWNAGVEAVKAGIEQVKQWASEAGSAILDQASKLKDLFGL